MTLSCDSCTFLNNAGAAECEMCGKSFTSSFEKKRQISDDLKSPLHGNVSETTDEILNCPKCTFGNIFTACVCAVCQYSFDSAPAVFGNGQSVMEKNSSSNSSSDAMQDGLLTLLEDALLEQHANARISQQHKKRQRLEQSLLPTFKLCSPLVPHVTQKDAQEGVHWSCGYRNIQMMCYTVQRMRSLNLPAGEQDLGLFGSGDVPDVAGLQLCIEKAWRAGFDRMGCEQMGGSLFGGDDWIGATECAALLRFLGLRASIVDFHCPKTLTTKCSGAAEVAGVQCPVARWVKDYFDRKHSFLQPPLPATYVGAGKSPDVGKVGSSTNSDEDGSGNSKRGSPVSEDSDASRGCRVDHQLLVPPLPPLYFQHQGHSRTIVGYEQTSTKFFLLLFDPSSSGHKLRVKLEQQVGWQCMLKRAEHTLTQGQFQIVYIEPGELLQPGSAAYESGKNLTSTVFSNA